MSPISITILSITIISFIYVCIDQIEDRFKRNDKGQFVSEKITYTQFRSLQGLRG